MTLFRSSPSRIYYGENRTAAVYDEYAMAVGVAAGILGLAWLCVGPTCKRKWQTAVVNAAYAFAIFVFAVIILGLTCKSWQSGTVFTSAPYAAYSNTEVNGTVGLYVGLSSFNVTLKGEPEFQNVSDASRHGQAPPGKEQINYNEIVEFGTRQGRVGFSEHSNQVNQEYRRMQGRGLPTAISWAIELFTNDGDDMRWGRNFRVAGYYAHVALWTSLPMWMLTLVTLAAGLWGISASFHNDSRTADVDAGGLNRRFLLKSQLLPPSILCVCTGVLLMGAPSIYAAILALSPGRPVSIHFSSGDLELRYGWCFWLTGATGLLVLGLGAAGMAWCLWGYSDSLQQLECVWEGVALQPKTNDVPIAHRKQMRHTRRASGGDSSAVAAHKHAHADGSVTSKSNGRAKSSSPFVPAPAGFTPALPLSSASGNRGAQRVELSPPIAGQSHLSFPSPVQQMSPADELALMPTPTAAPQPATASVSAMELSSLASQPAPSALAPMPLSAQRAQLALNSRPLNLAPILDLADEEAEAAGSGSSPAGRAGPKDATVAAGADLAAGATTSAAPSASQITEPAMQQHFVSMARSNQPYASRSADC